MPSADFFESLNKPQWVKDLGTVEPRSPFRQLSYHPATTDKLPPPTPPPGFREYVLMRHAHGPAPNLHAAPSAAVQPQRRGTPQRARRSGGALPSLALAAQRVDAWIAQNPDQVSTPRALSPSSWQRRLTARPLLPPGGGPAPAGLRPVGAPRRAAPGGAPRGAPARAVAAGRAALGGRAGARAPRAARGRPRRVSARTRGGIAARRGARIALRVHTPALPSPLPPPRPPPRSHTRTARAHTRALRRRPRSLGRLAPPPALSPSPRACAAGAAAPPRAGPAARPRRPSPAPAHPKGPPAREREGGEGLGFRF